MKLDEHIDVLLHCVIFTKTVAYDASIQVARVHELEIALQQSLPTQYESVKKDYKDVTTYLTTIQQKGSEVYDEFYNLAKEGFQVMTEEDYGRDPRQLEPLSYHVYDKPNSFVFLVLPYNKNRINQKTELEVQRMVKEQKKELKRRIKKHQTTKQDKALEREILKFYQNNQVTGQESLNRLDLKRRVNNMVNKVWPNQGVKVVMFGSSVNGLGADEGDLDLCIKAPGRPPRRNERRHRMDIEDIYNMEFLSIQLEQMGMTDIKAINNAHVPICKFKDPKTGLACDINANSQLGVENTHMIRQYVKLDKRVGPFLFAIKFFANKKNINQTAHGTISSYAYYLLGLHYLMAVLQYPVIPSLQQLGTRCRDPIHCNYTNNVRVEGYDVRYHDCVEVKTNTKYELSNTDQRFDEYTYWEGRNGDNLGFLIRDFFRWMSDMTAVVQPKSIITSDGMPWIVSKDMWWDDPLIIQDPFIIKKNIGYPCTELGLQTITHDFQVASEKFEKEEATFAEVCGVIVDGYMRDADEEPEQASDDDVIGTEDGELSEEDKRG